VAITNFCNLGWCQIDFTIRIEKKHKIVAGSLAFGEIQLIGHVLSLDA
jgi:hypothetical protein